MRLAWLALMAAVLAFGLTPVTATQDSARATFTGGSGSVMLNGETVNGGIWISAELNGEIVATSTTEDDGSWRLVVDGVGTVQLLVDGFLANGGLFRIDEYGVVHSNLMLVAGVRIDATPRFLVLHGEPGTVTLYGAPAPQGARIAAVDGDFSSYSTTYDVDAGWSLKVPYPAEDLTLTVDGSHTSVGGFTPELSWMPLWFANLDAGLWSREFWSGPGSVTIGGVVAAPGTRIEARSGSRVLAATLVKGDGSYEFGVPRIRGVREFFSLWIGDQPTYIRPFKADATGRTHLKLSTDEDPALAKLAQALHLWDVVLAPVIGWPTLPENLATQQLEVHTFSGDGLPNGTIRAVVPRDVMPEDSGPVITTASIVDGSWTMRIPLTLARLAVLETGAGRDLRRTKEYVFSSVGQTTVSPSEFSLEREKVQIIWGRGFGEGDLWIHAPDDRSFRTVPIVNGEWHAALTKNADQRFVLRVGDGDGALYTGIMQRTLGQLTEVKPSQFTSRTYESIVGEREPLDLTVNMSAGNPNPGSEDIRIAARKGLDGQIEFGIRVIGTDDPIFPRQRFLKVDAPIGKWLKSTTVRIGEDVAARVIARRLANGSTEFGVIASDANDTHLFPTKRFFPNDAEHDKWLISSILTVEGSP